MTERVSAILVGLSCLLGLSGCGGTEPPAAPPIVQPQGVETGETQYPPTETVDPRETQALPRDVPQERAEAEPNDVQTDGPEKAAAPGPLVAEPNEVPDEREPIEPNDAAPLEPEESALARSEPNEAPDVAPPPVESTEPNEPEAAGDQATVLPAFVEGYQAILDSYVRDDGRVDYSSIDRRRLELKRLLMRLDELDPNAYEAWPAQTQLAFWINAYNLKTLDVIARNYPIESSWWLRLTWPPSDIRHIRGIWTDYRFIVMDEEFTLQEVEQRFFRKAFGDPRVFLAVTYASRSSPPLRRTVYRGKDLDKQLDEQVKRFLSSPEGLRIDRQNMAVHLSALFKPTWRGKEFVGRYGTDKKFKSHPRETRAVLNFITRYLTREDVYFLEVENYTLEYINYDWRLNDTARGY
jgi:hypothetical protein